jgi:LmbE family N-acetylglucosaminyl deacetylase
MDHGYYFWTIEQFFEAASKWERPLFVMAHQDDELGYGGLIQRLGKKTEFCWVTNGDGLFFLEDMEPADYGKLRMAEAIRAVGSVGIPEKNTRCLAFSEVEIYRRMANLRKDPAYLEKDLPFWKKIRDTVREEIFDISPDAVFTGAWQGGHPEHDLTHYFTRLAVDELERDRGRPVPFFHLPEYEYTILVAFRFHPLYKGRKLMFDLTAKELENKRGIMDQYPSQQDLFDKFESVLGKVGWVSGLFGGPKNAHEFMATEHFGPVPPDLDYTKSTHTFDFFNYMFDDFEGTPIGFFPSIRPVVQALSRKRA